MNRPLTYGGWAWSLIVAVLLSQRALSAVLLTGWIFRVMQRETARTWWRDSTAIGKGNCFRDFCGAQEETVALAHRPRWCFATPVERSADRLSGIPWWRRAVHSISLGAGRNAVRGIQAVFNTSVLLGPAGMLWWLGWSSGWNNSFHKGYEQTFLGASIALAGVAWFCVAMLHLPLAQARQASTGDWRRFYDFRLVATLARIRWRGSLLLAGAYSLLSIPVSVIALGPQFAGSANQAMPSWTNAELLGWLDAYYLWTAWVIVLAVMLLQVSAARLYSRAVVDGIRCGAVMPSAFSPSERVLLARLELDRPAVGGASSGIILTAATTAGRLAFRTSIATALLLIWFSFAAQIFVTQFFSYQGARGWLNQPLVQVPWMRSIPAHLQPEASRTVEAAQDYSDSGNQ